MYVNVSGCTHGAVVDCNGIICLSPSPTLTHSLTDLRLYIFIFIYRKKIISLLINIILEHYIINDLYCLRHQENLITYPD